MGAKFESHGEIEILCDASTVRPGLQAKLMFSAWEDTEPPFKIRVWSPAGNLILERVIRVLPTTEPQSPPPIAFTVNHGRYKIEILEVKGKSTGEAVLTID